MLMAGHRGVFDSLVSQRRSEFVARQILDLIRRGVFRVGDKLPPERQIAEETGVSRPSVREAIVALQLLGILEAVPGKGTFVVRDLADVEMMVDPLAFLSLVFRSGTNPFNILQARQVMEIGMVDHLVANVEDTHLAKLEAILDRMAAAVEAGDHEAYDREDMAFHRALAEATGNPVLERVLSLLLKKMREQLWQEIRQRYYFCDPHYMPAGLEVHRRILAALRERDHAEALEAMRHHFDQSHWLRHLREIVGLKDTQ